VVASLLAPLAIPQSDGPALGNQPSAPPSEGPVSLAATINVSTLPSTVNPYDIIYDPSNGFVYMSAITPNLTVIQAASLRVLSPLWAGGPSVGLAYDDANGFLYVTGGFTTNTTTVVNTATGRIVTSIPTSDRPWGIAYDSSNQFLYVANLLSNTVSVINGTSNRLVDSIAVGTYPMHVAYDRLNGDVYVTNTGSNNVSVIDGTTDEAVASIPVPAGQAIGVATDDQTGEVYVSSNCPNGVTVINGSTNKVATFIATGQSYFPPGCTGAQNDDTSAVTVASEFHLLYVTDAFAGTVSLVNMTNQSVASVVQVGQYPVPMALDSSDSLLFVAKYGATNVSVLGPASTPPAGKGTSTSTYLGLTASQWFAIWVATLVVAVGFAVVWQIRRNPRR
jgi:YVTN family beta-propeller protein